MPQLVSNKKQQLIDYKHTKASLLWLRLTTTFYMVELFWLRSAVGVSVWTLIMMSVAFSDSTGYEWPIIKLYTSCRGSHCIGKTNRYSVHSQSRCFCVWLYGWQTAAVCSGHCVVSCTLVACESHRLCDSYTGIAWSLPQVNLVSRKPICAICRTHGLCFCTL